MGQIFGCGTRDRSNGDLLAVAQSGWYDADTKVVSLDGLGIMQSARLPDLRQAFPTDDRFPIRKQSHQFIATGMDYDPDTNSLWFNIHVMVVSLKQALMVVHYSSTSLMFVPTKAFVTTRLIKRFGRQLKILALGPLNFAFTPVATIHRYYLPQKLVDVSKVVSGSLIIPLTIP